MAKRLLIIGSGGHAGQVIDAVEMNNEYEIVGLIDDFLQVGIMKHNYPIIGKIVDIENKLHRFDYAFIAIGDNNERKRIHDLYPNLNYIKVIHPSAIVSKRAIVFSGSYIGAGAVLANNTLVDKQSIVNTNASLDHDSVLGKFSSLNPNCATGGNVTILEQTSIGMGTNIRNGVTVGSNCLIGMGSTITKDVPNGTKTKGAVIF